MRQSKTYKNQHFILLDVFLIIKVPIDRSLSKDKFLFLSVKFHKPSFSSTEKKKKKAMKYLPANTLKLVTASYLTASTT